MASRGGFSNRLGFIAAAAGSAVGLGNIWKYPFEVGNGGGAAFVLIYLLFCFTLCYPVLVTEIAIGRKAQKNPVGAFKVLGYPQWSVIGKMGVLSGVLILSFYNVVAGWAFGFFLEILIGNFQIGSQFGDFVKDIFKIGAYGICFMTASAYIVSKGISGGIERASKIMMPALFILLILLVAYAITLPNAWEGIKFYIIPDFSKINAKVLYTALGQGFFSLSIGMGALITYGSYVSKNDNIITSAAWVTIADISVAFIAGFMMFPLVFSQGLAPNGGAGLVFQTLPSVFGSFGTFLGILVGASFFLLLSFAALTSTVSLLEVPVSYLVDEKQVPRTRAVWLTATFIYLVGIPSLMANGYSDFFTNFIAYGSSEKAIDFMTFIGHVANDTFLPFGGLLISIFAAYVWKKENLIAELEHGFPNFSKTFIAKYIGFAVSYICPVVLAAIFTLTVLDRFLGISIIK
ncbi:MAG: sodium-dependent transporter [Flammeovirgaceae bacterium]